MKAKYSLSSFQQTLFFTLPYTISLLQFSSKVQTNPHPFFSLPWFWHREQNKLPFITSSSNQWKST